jgi:UDP-N-acetylmuramyl pentapeptide phosphotransferase/UDP-N-acetylglucosamine-1-phosphate transferase
MFRLAQDVAGSDPKGWVDTMRHDVIPVASAFAVWVAVLFSYRRSAGRSRRSEERPTGRRAFGALASTVIGGYLVFLSIIVVFYFVLGGETPRFIYQALGEGSLLTFGIVVPVFLVLSWLDERRWLRPTRRRP